MTTPDASVPAESAEAARVRSAVWRRFLAVENLGLALTLGYLFLSAVGMLHRGLVFLAFRVNIVDYAEPSDFLLAALRDPLIVIASLAPVPIFLVYFAVVDRMKAKHPDSWWLHGGARTRKLYEEHRTGMYLLTVFLWALAFSLYYAGHVIDDLKAGKGRRVDVDVVAGTLRAPTDTVKPLLLGTTQKFVFLYDERSRTTTVIPTDNIAQIRYQRRKP